MINYLATPGEVIAWLADLAAKQPMFFPLELGHASFRFEKVEDASQIQFERYRPSVVPPVKLLVPARDEILRFKKNPEAKTEIVASLDSSFRIVAGVRPCDLKGIFLMDLFFKEGVKDAYYLSRRENTAIVGIACTEPCDERAFCAAVDSLDHRAGSDIFLTLVKGGDFLMEVLTERGASLVEGCEFRDCEDGPAKKIGAIADRPEEFGRSWQTKVQDLSAVIDKQYDSAIWETHVERCFSCGTCNLVCPTCYCFDIIDDFNLDIQTGNRVRTWDGCMLPHFAEVAGGHNFRPDPAGRQRHRVKRKFQYLVEKFEHGSVCVGCGRCGRQCTSQIDIFDIVADLVKEEGTK